MNIMAVNDRKTRAELLKIIQECIDFPLEEQEQMADAFCDYDLEDQIAFLESLKKDHEEQC